MSDQSILQIDTDEELARAMRQLKTLPQQLGAPNVLKNALNSTARKVRQQIIKDSKGRYALKEKKALQSESKILSASASTLEAAVLAKGPMRDIMDFMTQPNTDTAAAAAKVLNSGAMKPLEAGGLKAFITTFRSGHTAIVQRRGAERLFPQPGQRPPDDRALRRRSEPSAGGAGQALRLCGWTGDYPGGY